MAGMPNPIVFRASEIMSHLEHDKSVKKSKENLKSIPKNNYQLSMFELDPKFQEAKEMIDKIDINAISPIEALLKLHEIKKKIEGWLGSFSLYLICKKHNRMYFYG